MPGFLPLPALVDRQGRRGLPARGIQMRPRAPRKPRRAVPSLCAASHVHLLAGNVQRAQAPRRRPAAGTIGTAALASASKVEEENEGTDTAARLRARALSPVGRPRFCRWRDAESVPPVPRRREQGGAALARRGTCTRAPASPARSGVPDARAPSTAADVFLMFSPLSTPATDRRRCRRALSFAGVSASWRRRRRRRRERRGGY